MEGYESLVTIDSVVFTQYQCVTNRRTNAIAVSCSAWPCYHSTSHKEKGSKPERPLHPRNNSM